MKHRHAVATSSGVIEASRLAASAALCLFIMLAWGHFSRAAVVRAANPALKLHMLPVPMRAAGQPGHFSHIQINDSFGARDTLRTARRLVASGHVTQAVRTYQRITQKYGDSVIQKSDGTYESVRQYVWAHLLRTPAIERGLYDQIYGLKAQQVIQQARQTHSLFELTAACERYFAADAAATALQYVAARQFERGRFSVAANLWIQLLRHPALTAQRPLLLHDAAVAAWLAGEKDLADKLLRELAKDAPTATGIIAGKKVNLLANAKTVLRTAAAFRAPPEPGTWPTFEGNFRRNRMAVRGTLPAATMWVRPLHTFANQASTKPTSPQFQNELRQLLPTFGLTMDPATGKTSGEVLFSFPTCANGILYLNMQDRVKAVDINSGYTLWQYPRGTPPSNSAAANLATLIRALDHYSCTLSHGNIYTVLTRPGIPGQMMTPFGIPAARMEVVCINALSGKLKWQTSATRLVTGAAHRNVWPACIPMANRHAVFLVAAATLGGTGMNELNMVRLNAATGKVQWTHYLCTITGPAYGISPFNTINIIPAMADNTLYISTGLGADMALNADSGQVRWLHLNKAAFTPFTAMQYGINRRIPPWQINAPIVTGTRLIAMDNSFGITSRIHIYNRWTGEKLISLPTTSLHHADILLGVMNGNMVLAGTTISAVNIRTGKQMWTSVPIRTFGDISGRPFMTRRDIYIPLNTGLLLVNTGTGAVDNMTKWPAGNIHPSGNLLVTAHEVVVVNDHLTAGYARWKDALAYLTGRIKAHPKRPAPYLTLAEVAFRAGHNPLAQRMLNNAVKLALAEVAPSKSQADRIFRVCMKFANQSKHKSGLNQAELFYLQKASAIAGLPNQQVKWRMAMAAYYLAQSQPRMAITLLEEILAHAYLRSAAVDYRGVTEAAATAAQTMIQSDAIHNFGVASYAPWELKARKLLARFGQDHTTGTLEQIVLQYPNSMAARHAGRLLATHFAIRHQWSKAYDMLLWRRAAGSGTETNKAWELSRLCSALAHLRHWNQALVLALRGAGEYPTYQWTSSRKWTFLQYALHIKQTPAWEGLNHRAKLEAKSGSHLVISGALSGDLLPPLEHTPRFRRYDLFLIGKKVSAGYRISARSVSDLKPRWHYLIAGVHRALLVGYWKNLTILATKDRILALNTRTGLLAWTKQMASTSLRHAAISQLRNIVLPGMQQIMIMQNGVVMNGGIPGYNAVSPHFAAQWRIDAMQRALGATSYHIIKILPRGLLVARQSNLMLYNPADGKPAWKRPATLGKYGTISLLRQTPRYIAAAMGLPIKSIVLISRRTGRVAGDLPTHATNHFYWLRPDPAGQLLLCGLHGAAMFDPGLSRSAPIWSRNDLHDSFPTAASLSVDGLIMPTATGMVCLDTASGAIRWNQPGLHAGLSSSGLIWMQTALNHNTLVMLTPRNIMAIFTRTGDIAWKAEFVMQTRPPLTSAQIGDPDIVAVAQGPVGPNPDIMHLFLINQMDRRGRLDNGSIVLDQQLARSNHNTMAPDIESWLLVNGGILFEINGVVFYCHT